MPLQKVTLKPGINTQFTPTLLEGGWSSASLVRFRDGLPENIYGWAKYVTTQLSGTPRGIHSWTELSGTPDLAVGTSNWLYLMRDASFNDITPYVGNAGGVLSANPVAASDGNDVVTVTDLSYHPAVGQNVAFSGMVPFAAVNLSGTYQVLSTPSASTYTVRNANIAHFNYLLYSEQLDQTTWAKTAVAVSADAGNDSLGNTTLEKLTEDATTNVHSVTQSLQASPNQNWYAQAEVRQSSGTRNLRMWIYDQAGSGNRVEAYFTLSGAGTVAASAGVGAGVLVSATITSLGGGLYLCKLSGKPNTSGSVTILDIGLASGTTASYAGDGTSAILLGRVDMGVSNGPYVATTIPMTSSPGGGGAMVARYFLPANPVLLVDGSSTVTITDNGYQPIIGQNVSFSGMVPFGGINLNSGSYQVLSTPSASTYTINAGTSAYFNYLQYSEQLNNAAWAKLNVTVSADAGNDSTGAATLDKLTENTATAGHIVTQTLTMAPTQIYYWQGEVRQSAGTRNLRVFIYHSPGNANGIDAYFTLSGAGTVTSAGVGNGVVNAASITLLSSGLYLCKLSGKPDTSGTQTGVDIGLASGTTAASAVYTGDGTSAIMLGRVQLALADIPYTPTTGSVGNPAGGSAMIAQYLYAPGLADATMTSGYGTSGYGLGGYSLGGAGSYLVQPRIWSLDNWGEDLIASPYQGGIYLWDATTGPSTRAALLLNAPRRNNAVIMATPQMQIVAGGAEIGTTGVQDPMVVRWCDTGINTTWTAASINSAGSYRLSHGAYIVGLLAGQQQVLIWTNEGLELMSYIGQPLIYSFSRIGQSCGLIAPLARVAAAGAVYWMGDANFFYYDGTVHVLPCTVWDFVFRNLNVTQKYKCHCGINSLNNEVIFFFPSKTVTSGVTNTEIDRYVKFNWVEQIWTTGFMARTTWQDKEVYADILATSPDGYLYAHEQKDAGADGANLDVYIQSGYFDLGDGTDYLYVDRCIPDFLDLSGIVTVQVYLQEYPNVPATVLGPFNVDASTPYFTFRGRARQAAIRLSSVTPKSNWRLGAVRFNISPDGRR